MHWSYWSLALSYGLAQDCSNSIVNALELPQSCAKPSNYPPLFEAVCQVYVPVVHYTHYWWLGSKFGAVFIWPGSGDDSSRVSGYHGNQNLKHLTWYVVKWCSLLSFGWCWKVYNVYRRLVPGHTFWHLSIIVPADILVPYSARPSVATVLTINSSLYCFGDAEIYIVIFFMFFMLKLR